MPYQSRLIYPALMAEALADRVTETVFLADKTVLKEDRH